MRKIISGDQVQVICGDFKGKSGSVMKVVKIKSNKLNSQVRYKVIVSGVNLKYYNKKSQTGIKRESKEFPIDISNVSLLNKETNSISKVAFKFDNSVKKRYFKKTGGLV
jgi:ribosomal protein L24